MSENVHDESGLNSLRNGGRDYLLSWVNTSCTHSLFCGEDGGESTPLWMWLWGDLRILRDRVALPWVKGPHVSSTGSGLRAHHKPPSLQGPFPWNSLGPGGTYSQACHSCFYHKHIPAPFKQVEFSFWEQGHNEGLHVGIKKNHGGSQHYAVKWSSIIIENSQIVFQDNYRIVITIELQNFRAVKEIRYY